MATGPIALGRIALNDIVFNNVTLENVTIDNQTWEDNSTINVSGTTVFVGGGSIDFADVNLINLPPLDLTDTTLNGGTVVDGTLDVIGDSTFNGNTTFVGTTTFTGTVNLSGDFGATSFTSPEYNVTASAANPGAADTFWNLVGNFPRFGANFILTDAAPALNAVPVYGNTTGTVNVTASATSATMARPLSLTVPLAVGDVDTFVATGSTTSSTNVGFYNSNSLLNRTAAIRLGAPYLGPGLSDTYIIRAYPGGGGLQDFEIFKNGGAINGRMFYIATNGECQTNIGLRTPYLVFNPSLVTNPLPTIETTLWVNGITLHIGDNDIILRSREASVPAAATVTSPWGPTVLGLRLSMSGGMVTISVNERMPFQLTTSASPVTTGPVIPAAFRPTIEYRGAFVVVDNNLHQLGNIVIMPDGSIHIYPVNATSTFTNATLAGWEAFTATYDVLNPP